MATAMLGGRHDDAVVKRIRARIAHLSGYPVSLLEPLQVVRYEQGQKYEGHHDFFDVCDLEDKASNGRRQVTFLVYLVDMPEATLMPRACAHGWRSACGKATP